MEGIIEPRSQYGDRPYPLSQVDTRELHKTNSDIENSIQSPHSPLTLIEFLPVSFHSLYFVLKGY